MRYLLALILTVAVVAQVSAFDLGAVAPDKPVSLHQPPPPDLEVIRQGGDTVADAVMVALPVINMTGTTAGYNDDYDEICPWGSSSPDVVYTFIPDYDMSINVNTLGSAYDTKVYIYDEDLYLVACNDDFWPDYTSFLENVPVMGGARYFLIIDGYTGAFGDYLLNITEYAPCELECPQFAEPEGEPPLAVGYEDTYNGGCSDGGTGGWQYWDSPELCGVSGFYLNQGSNFRDTDWFEIPIGPDGYLEIEGDAELQTHMLELGPQDCDSVGVFQQMLIGPCNPATMTIIGEPGSIVWFWVGPTSFESPDGSDVYEYTYVLINHTNVVAVEEHTWSEVKSLFR